MPKSLRKVLFTKFLEKGQVESTLSDEGFFHKWGKDVVINDNKYYNVTVAIVEVPTGEVFCVPPDALTFIESVENISL